jgi:hypothetical protein
MSDPVLIAALERIAVDLTDPQREALVKSWVRSQKLETPTVPVIGPAHTASALMRQRLAWRPSGNTTHMAELTELGMAMAEHLANKA